MKPSSDRQGIEKCRQMFGIFAPFRGSLSMVTTVPPVTAARAMMKGSAFFPPL